MLDNLKTMKIADLQAYLNSVDDEIANEKKLKINEYEEKCKEDERKINLKKIQKIEKDIDKINKRRKQTKDEILSLIKDIEAIPERIEKLQIAEYMIYRVDLRRAEKIVERARNNYSDYFNKLTNDVNELIEETEEFSDLGTISFDEYKVSQDSLNEVKEKYKEEYTEEERLALIKNELDIIEKVKIFNTTPIPHEILKEFDKDLQLKVQKFNNARQKRINIVNTLKEEYLKLTEPKEIETMIEDALAYIETISNVLTEPDYNKIVNYLLKRKRKLYRHTSETRDIIKYKEKKTGINTYNLQEARYQRMTLLTDTINEASSIIKINDISQISEKLDKLKTYYKKEKQFANVINKINEDSGNKSNENIELKSLEEQIKDLEKKIKQSKKIIKEKEEIISKTKQELLILWKIEIDNTISNKKEKVELLENEEIKEERSKGNSILSFLFGLKRAQAGKHART